LSTLIVNSLRDSEIRRKLAFTVLALFVYRLGSFVPLPPSPSWAGRTSSAF
jgi:preprotein translocase subunit SecY